MLLTDLNNILLCGIYINYNLFLFLKAVKDLKSVNKNYKVIKF